VPPAQRPGVIERGDVRIDLAARRVYRAREEVRLTPTEFNLLVELASRPGEAVSHETLLQKVWGPEYRTEGHYLKVYIGRLRDKLESEPETPRLIETVRGIGYRFAFTKD
jgi:two-component system KDP operon response regulator KdpE